MKFNICLMQPPGYVHSLALLEAAEYCKSQIAKNGYEAILSKNRFLQQGINIVFGAHINPELLLELPNNLIIFNTEQLAENSVWTKEDYKKLLAIRFVWDYSDSNLKFIPHQNKSLISFYDDDSLRRIKNCDEKEWDLCFYGSLNERRNKLIFDLESKGLKVKTIFGVYGPERDHIISRSKAVLNLHFYDSQVLQQIRLFYPLINDVAVISENYPKASAPDFYQDCLFLPGPSNFVDYVASLFEPSFDLEAATKEKVAHFKKAENSNYFQNSIHQSLLHFESKCADLSESKFKSKKIHLGSGKDYRFGYLNIDINANVCPDLQLDLSKEIAFPASFNTIFHDEITLFEGMADEIIANDVLEHVIQLDALMYNCLRLLKCGGKFIISVPYDTSYGAWQDPTHVRAFNQNSWLYYTDWFWYLGWFEYKFDLEKLDYTLSQYGQDLIDKKIDAESVLRSPRAIDSMQICLVKRETTLEEKTLARSFSNNYLLDQFN